MSKPTASRGWTFAFCIVPILAVIFLAVPLVVAPASHRGNAGALSATSFESQLGVVKPAARDRIRASYATLPLAFEQNQGQTDNQVKYMARGDGYTLFLTANDAVFSLHSPLNSRDRSPIGRGALPKAKMFSGKRNTQNGSSAVVRMQLSGGNSLAKVEASGKLSGSANYFIGDDPGKWCKNVPRYARVSYHNVYPGVNMAFHGAQGQLEFDFVVAPGADPQPIAFNLSGAQGLKTDELGNLIVSSTAGDVLLHKPVAYQDQNAARQAVDARFVLKADGQVSFELGKYDHSRELVIDPSVSYAYSTYLGGSAEDDGFGIAFDSSGNAYVTGQTMSTDFPTKGGVPPNTSTGGTFDVFVTKIAADGSSLIYSTYIAGSSGTKGNDAGNTIAVDSSGDAFVAGGTQSSNFPTTTGAYQTALVLGATGNAFILELNPAGDGLTYSTYLGGEVDDKAFGVAVDSTGNIYAAGQTSSSKFPSKNALQTTQAGGFLAKLKPAGGGSNDLLFSTFVGGGLNDFVSAVALDSSANPYVTGQTESATLHTTAGVLQSTFGGVSDAFVTAIKTDGSAYIYSTYLGGSDIDIGFAIAVDSSGNAYVTGQTASSNTSATPFPTTAGAFQTKFGGDPYDAFVSKLNSSGTALVYSSYLGGTSADYGVGIAVDGSGNAYLTGRTLSSSGFLLKNPTQATFQGTSDAFVSEVNSAGSQLLFSTYLGGIGDQDTLTNGGIAVDSLGANIYVTGNTTATDFPIFPNSAGVFQPTYGGGTDAFVVKYAQQTFSIAATAPAAVSPGTSATSTVTLTALNGYNSPVKLTCSVAGTGSPLPACSTTSFSTNPLTPGSPGTTTKLTITTTGPTSSISHPRKVFYAMFLPIIGISLVGVGFNSRRKKVVGILMIAMALAALLLMPACGGGSSSGGGGGGGTSGTPAGSYTVTITGTGTDAATTTQSTQVTLTVN